MTEFFAELSSSMPPETDQSIVDWEFDLLERAKEIYDKYQTVDLSEMTFAERVELMMYLDRVEGGQ